MDIFILIGVAVALALAFILLRKKPVKEIVVKYPLQRMNWHSLNWVEKQMYIALQAYRQKQIKYFDELEDKEIILKEKSGVLDALACQLAREHARYMVEQKSTSHDNINDRRSKVVKLGGHDFSEITNASASISTMWNQYVDSPEHEASLSSTRPLIGIGAESYGDVWFTCIVFFRY